MLYIFTNNCNISPSQQEEKYFYINDTWSKQYELLLLIVLYQLHMPWTFITLIITSCKNEKFHYNMQGQ